MRFRSLKGYLVSAVVRGKYPRKKKTIVTLRVSPMEHPFWVLKWAHVYTLLIFYLSQHKHPISTQSLQPNSKGVFGRGVLVGWGGFIPIF